jgi:arylsulfatase A-like enzyme
MYLNDEDELELPPNFDREKLQQWFNIRNPRESVTVQQVRLLRALYFGFTTQLDAALGELFDGMRQRGLLNNTIVVFTSDHGDNLGEHGRFFKRSMLQGSVGVPLLVHWPGQTVQEARVIEDNVSHIDLVSTLVQAAGIRPPNHMPGRDMLPLMLGEEGWENHPVWSEGYSRNTDPDQLMLKKGDYKLVYERDAFSGEFRKSLYNIRVDPWELQDLATDPEVSGIFGAYCSEADAYLRRIRGDLPSAMPEVVSRVPYDISWPADPWQPVKIRVRRLR